MQNLKNNVGAGLEPALMNKKKKSELVNKLVGVLAIQGDFEAHIKMIKELEVDYKEIRNPHDLANVTHLIMPGGESTTIRLVAQKNGLWDRLKKFAGPIMGTCMGSILMAKKIESPSADGMNLIDMTISRNAYGRQVNSFTAFGKIEFIKNDYEMVFIRAPKIMSFGEDIKPIAWLDNEITGVIYKNRLALTFHPELSGDTAVHNYFLNLTA